MSVETTLTALGYRLVQTGGGCTAYEKTTDDGIVLVTRSDNPSAPERIEEPVCVGLYQSHDNLVAGHGRTQRCTTLPDAIDNVLPMPFGHRPADARRKHDS